MLVKIHPNYRLFLHFGDLFLENIFGDLPSEVTTFLYDSGFDRLVTLTTLTSDDVDSTEKDSGNDSKLKLD